jgi:hypothetical protein
VLVCLPCPFHHDLDQQRMPSQRLGQEKHGRPETLV